MTQYTATKCACVIINLVRYIVRKAIRFPHGQFTGSQPMGSQREQALISATTSATRTTLRQIICQSTGTCFVLFLNPAMCLPTQKEHQPAFFTSVV